MNGNVYLCLILAIIALVIWANNQAQPPSNP
jgi:hypothetical protein